MPSVIRTRALAALVVFCAACSGDRGGDFGTPGADGRPSRVATATSQAKDSAGADDAALAALPDRLRADMDLRAALTPEALRDSARAYCQPLGDRSAPEERRRLSATMGDGTRAVLFVRAARLGGLLRRVELVRGVREGGARRQRGFIWDASSDDLQSIEWFADGRTETTVLPRGGPAPRALRALGRRLLVLPCTGARATG